MSKFIGTWSRIKRPISAEDPLSSDTDAISGRPVFDARGNAVWQWKTDTGEFSVDVDTQRLKALEASELSIDESPNGSGGLSLQNEPLPGGGFNPYNRSIAESNRAPSPAVAAKNAQPQKSLKDTKR